MEKQADDYTLTGPYQLRNIKMETIIKELPIPKEVIEVQEALQLPEPESNGYGKDVGILVAGVIAAAVLYKLWLKFGKK